VFWLFVFGMLHAYLLFFGDILVCYALAGAVVFLFRKWSPKLLIGIGALVLAGLVVKGLIETDHLEKLRALASSPDASEATKKAWAQNGFILNPPASMGETEIKGYRGDFFDAVKARSMAAMILQTVLLFTETIWEAIAQMMIGIGLYRLGFFTLGWKTRSYALMMAIGWGVGIPVMIWLTYGAVQSGFEPIVMARASYWGAIPRPFIALAHASAILLLVRAGAARWLMDRLAAAGRMALSNYLGTSIVTSFVFCGYGLGLYGQLERYQLYAVVAGVWLLILLWSKPWMSAFHYGPFEWLWRSLVRWKAQPFLKRQAGSATEG
jgi:uncharacterized protein